MARSLAALVLLLASTAHAAVKPVRIDVPRTMRRPVVDGRIGSAEWTRAARVQLMDGGHALLLHDGTYLYVGLVARRAAAGSVCTMNGDQVRVLHASAALGTALFDRRDGTWALTQGFTFTNRDTGNSQAAHADRKQFLGTQGWFANAHPAGQLQREYQIRLAGRNEVPLVLSLMSWVKADEYDLDVWPDSVVDGCAELDLAGGWTDREYTFAPESWGVAAMQ